MADTIMMTRSTSTTSTMGVTLMPVIGARFPPRAAIVPAMGFSLRSCFSVGFRRRHGAEPAGHRKRCFRRIRTRREAAAVTVRFEEGRHVLGDCGDVALDVADALLEDVVR